MRISGWVATLVVFAFVGCAGPDNLAPREETGGPRVVYDLNAKPLPDIPQPNNAGTRLDDSSPTGRRLNVSEEAVTAYERRVRSQVNRMNGFGVYSPITVGFDAPLDARDLKARHDDRDVSNDGILLVRLDEGEACGDRLVPLDVGQGHFPLVLESPCKYNYPLWEGDYNCVWPDCEGDDSRSRSGNLLFETYDEDLNGNGVLDPYEDTDYDGVLDKPNTWSGRDVMNDEAYAQEMCGDEPYDYEFCRQRVAADDLITFYEKETNTLMIWPLVPMREATTYGVVLTRNVKDAQGRAIESAFPGVAAADQVPDLKKLQDILPCHGLSVDDVAFAWTFTTGTPSRELLAVREGLYGSGPFAELKDGAPASSLEPRIVRDPDAQGNLPENPYVLPMSFLQPVLAGIAPVVLTPSSSGTVLAAETPNIDYWVVGQFDTPYLLVDKDGRATPKYPDDQDEYWDLDVDEGRIVWGTAKVDFICAIPKATEFAKPPFPVAIYGHGYSGASFENLGFSGRFTMAGMALCTLEAPGHGVIIPEDEVEILNIVNTLLPRAGLYAFYDAYVGGRTRDLNNDGIITSIDNGGDFWVGDILHTRDMVRQLIVDHMQFVRILRSADGVAEMDIDVDGDGRNELLADFNGDGVPDIGGWKDLNGNGVWDEGEPENGFYAWGQSLGGIMAGALAGAEPAVRASAPSAGAAGLTRVAVRSTNVGVPEAALLPMLGPFITFNPHTDRDEDGNRVPGPGVDVGFLAPDINRPARPVFHTSQLIAPGDRIVVRNLSNGKEREGFATEDLRFRIPIQCDAMNRGQIRVLVGLTDEDNEPRDLTEAQALQFGDRLEVIIYDGWDGEEKERIDQVTVPYMYHGAAFPEGTPLVALHEGFGHPRNSPEFRKLLGFAQMIVEPGDPAVYVPHVFQRPLDFPYESADLRNRRAEGELPSFVVYHSVGDSRVPISDGLALARTAGIIDLDTPLAQYGGRTENELLVDYGVTEGNERLMRHVQRHGQAVLCEPYRPWYEWECPAVRLGEEERYRAFFDEESGCAADHGTCPRECPAGEVCHYDGVCVPCEARCAEDLLDPDESPVEGVHFDLYDMDGGQDRLILPEHNLDPPLRGVVDSDAGVYALRIPYLDRQGTHGVPPSIPTRAYDINAHVINQIVHLFFTDGREFIEGPCLEDGSCEELVWFMGN